MSEQDFSVLVLGKAGQLAHELLRAPWPDGWRITFSDRSQIDLSEPDEAARRVESFSPEMVINAAAYTAVDRAETEPELARRVNALAPASIAAVCAARNIPFVTVSTDYVFDGSRPGPYRETDPVAPLGAYGISKEQGERLVRSANSRHLILRTSWVFSAVGTNFLRTMLRLGSEREVLRVVADQRGKPTAAGDLAKALVTACSKLSRGEGSFGTFHVANEQVTTWYEFATTIFDEVRSRGHATPKSVEAISTAAYPTPAKRPFNSELDCSEFTRVFGVAMRPWRAALIDVLDELIPRFESTTP